jgi:hypothetical protein
MRSTSQVGTAPAGSTEFAALRDLRTARRRGPIIVVALVGLALVAVIALLIRLMR